MRYRDWLQLGASEELVRQYEGGYRAVPESEHEVRAALVTARAGLSEDTDPW